MIIYPQALILSESNAGRPLTHARIGYQTYTRGLAASAVTVSSESSDGPKDAPLRPDTMEFWQPTSLPATWELDLGAPQDISYVGLVGTFGGKTVKVETSTGAVAGSPSAQVWTTFASDVLPGDDSPLLFLDGSIVGRYVKVTITGSGAIPRMAVAYVGAILAMQRPIYGGHSPVNLSRETVLRRSLSRGGQFLGQGFRRHGVAGSAAFRHLTASWYRDNFDPFVKAARRFPFFFAWRPATFPLDVAYAWCPDDIAPSNMGVRTFMQVSFKMQGIGNE